MGFMGAVRTAASAAVAGVGRMGTVSPAAAAAVAGMAPVAGMRPVIRKRAVRHHNAENQEHGTDRQNFVAGNVSFLIVQKRLHGFFQMRKNRLIVLVIHCFFSRSLRFHDLGTGSVFPCRVKCIPFRFIINRRSIRLSIHKRTF